MPRVGKGGTVLWMLFCSLSDSEVLFQKMDFCPTLP